MPAYTTCFNDLVPVLKSPLSLVRKMQGSAQSLLVQDSDHRLWVLKPKSRLQGPNALANDLLGYLMCRAVGLPTPEAAICEPADTFFDDPATWQQTGKGWRRRENGLHFASRFFPDSEGTEAIEYLPSTLQGLMGNRADCLGMFIFDLWACHKDRRQSLFYEKGRLMHVTFIDHSHLFSGPHWDESNYYVLAGLVERTAVEESKEEGALDFWIARMQKTIPAALEAAITQIPTCWYDGDARRLVDIYLGRVNYLRSYVEDALPQVLNKSVGTIACEERVSDAPIRILSKRGADLWL